MRSFWQSMKYLWCQIVGHRWGHNPTPWVEWHYNEIKWHEPAELVIPRSMSRTYCQCCGSVKIEWMK